MIDTASKLSKVQTSRPVTIFSAYFSIVFLLKLLMVFPSNVCSVMARWQWRLTLWILDGRYRRLHYGTRPWAGKVARGGWVPVEDCKMGPRAGPVGKTRLKRWRESWNEIIMTPWWFWKHVFVTAFGGVGAIIVIVINFFDRSDPSIIVIVNWTALPVLLWQCQTHCQPHHWTIVSLSVCVFHQECWAADSHCQWTITVILPPVRPAADLSLSSVKSSKMNP